MKALVLRGAPERSFQIEDVPMPVLKDGEVLVRLLAASLNHRDQYIREGMYPGLTLPCTPGSDGCGVVEKVHDKEDLHWIGKEVIMNPATNYDPFSRSRDYLILGMPEPGTLAEYVVVKNDRLYEKPEYLTVEEASTLPLAGLTAYRAVFTQGQIDSSKLVLVTGFGGGVAQFACQFALAAEATVYITSGEDHKIAKALEVGVTGAANYHTRNWEKRLRKSTGDFDVIIDSAGGDQINNLLSILKPSGKLVLYGKTLGDPSKLFLFSLFWNQHCIQGTTLGTDEEFEAMLNFLKEKRIKPVIDSVRPFEDVVSAFDRMKKGKQSGKLVISF